MKNPDKPLLFDKKDATFIITIVFKKIATLYCGDFLLFITNDH